MTTANTTGSGRKIALRVLAPVLIAGAFAGLAGATEAAAAPAQPTTLKTAAAHLTKGFDLRNLSSQTIKLRGIEAPGNADGKPAIGTVLRPGESLHYEKVWWFGNTPQTKLNFESTDDQGRISLFQVELWVDSFLNSPSVMMPHSDGKVGALEVQGLGYSSSSATFVDRPGAGAIQVPAADQQRQADLLGRLCAEGKAACTFALDSSEPGPDQVMRKLTDKNIGTTPLNVSFKESFTFGTTNSVKVSGKASLKLMEVINLEMSAEYGVGWSESKTEEIVRSFTVPSGRKGIIEVTQATIRQTGTFTVTMGNTTWVLTGVYFDIPDKSKVPTVHVGDVAA